MFVLRDIALIILALEGVVFTLLILAVLGLINYGMIRFRWWHEIPRWFAIGRGYLGLGKNFIERACEVVRAPIVTVVTTQAGVAEGMRHLVRSGRGASSRPSGETSTEQGDEE
jgi:hypothetical protein